MEIDVNQLMDEITSTASGILSKDIRAVNGFSDRQLKGLATQTALVASGITSGQIDDSSRDFFLEQLMELSRNFVNTLVGLILVTVEKLWNAIVSILWETISAATGIQLPAFIAGK
jgi:hypothetical protein